MVWKYVVYLCDKYDWIMERSSLEKLYREFGLVKISDLDPSIAIDIKYASCDNFTGKVLYSENVGAFCEPELAEAVVNAQKDLKRICPDLSLIIFDAARPISVQKEMFEMVKNTPHERFIANPYTEYRGGFHNYGMAVDLAIVSVDGKLLDFGTEYDSFTETAHSGNEAELVKEGKLSIECYKNRMLLYYITGNNGLLPYAYEWWHYQLQYDEISKTNYKLLEF